MPSLEVRPFSDDHVEAAGTLLAERHRRHRAAEPLLPERFEDAAAAQAEVEAAWRKEDAAGTAAFRGGRLVGYLVGARADERRWGANALVEAAGHAADEPEVVRDLYAALAGRWHDEGRSRHYVLTPATDPDVLEAWYRLSFGQQQAHGICEVTAAPWPENVREAAPRDLDEILALAPLLSRHQELSPVFSTGVPTENVDELRAELQADIASDEIGVLLAEIEGRAAGLFEVAPIELSSMHSGLARPDGACYLAFAVTLPELRGSGAGLVLTDAAFAWAHAAGYATMVTDWRVTNLLSSRFWPRRGFRLSFLRLYRSIP